MSTYIFLRSSVLRKRAFHNAQPANNPSMVVAVSIATQANAVVLLGATYGYLYQKIPPVHFSIEACTTMLSFQHHPVRVAGLCISLAYLTHRPCFLLEHCCGFDGIDRCIMQYQRM